MTLTIGRVAFATGDAPAAWDVDSDGTVTLSGDLRRGSVDELLAAREQLVNHVGNRDEPVIPVTWDDDPSVDGYYRLDDVSLSTIPTSYSTGRLAWRGRLVPVRAFRRPEIVSALTSTVRTNENGLTVGAPVHAVPNGVEQWTWLPGVTAQQELRPTAPGPSGGGVLYRRVATGTGQTVARWLCPPEAWYRGSCAVTKLAGANQVPVVGRGDILTGWRAQNGLVRFWLATNGRLNVQWWMPSGRWTPPVAFNVAGFNGWSGVEITTNGPHQVTIRAQGNRSTVQGRTTLWLTIYRGSRTISMTTDTDIFTGHAITPTGANTAVTDNTTDATLTTATADTDGMHWVVTASDDFTVNTTTGKVEPDASPIPLWSFGLSAYFDTAFVPAAADSNSLSWTMRDWYATRIESVVVG